LPIIKCILNKAFCLRSSSDSGRCLIDRNEQRNENEGAKKMQLPEHHLQIVAGTARHRTAGCAFEQ
jgi:hypothetical protein